jgi:hypothetical protein
LCPDCTYRELTTPPPAEVVAAAREKYSPARDLQTDQIIRPDGQIHIESARPSAAQVAGDFEAQQATDTGVCVNGTVVWESEKQGLIDQILANRRK